VSTQTDVTSPPTRVRDVNVTGRRIVATIIDGVLLGAVYTALAEVFGTVTWIWVDGLHASAAPPVGVSIAYGLAVVLYYLLMETYVGQTLGKMVAGVEVVDEDTGGRASLGQVAGRTVLRVVDGLLAYTVAYVSVMATRKRQRLGDMAARTLVVRISS
jgi:uncharacterized RDD family membrane protein YckC